MRVNVFPARHRQSTLALAIALVLAIISGGHFANAEELSFNRDIRPLLSAACFRCHGFDEATRKADLRLDTADGAAKFFDLATADDNEIWKRVVSSDSDLVMPPPSETRQLSDEEKDLIRRWIESGGKYEQHWSLVPLRTPALPTLGEVLEGKAFESWKKKPIDRFLFQTMLRRQMKPRPEADRETLVRRVAFTLTGLPPTLEQVDAFLYDESKVAYENMVDRFLESPHYGEEMARHWLDVARYGDTHGLHLDNERRIWPYRDWVVKSFNENQPFDQFTIEQLAGDRLENPTQSQLVATGFNRCNVTTSEGGAIADEFLYRYSVERASTTFQTWMGLTGGCAVCHDHKYDPISAKEFYSFYSFFYSAADPAMDGNQSDTPPFLSLPTDEQQTRLAELKSMETTAEKRLDKAANDFASRSDQVYVETAEMLENKNEEGETKDQAVADATRTDETTESSFLDNATDQHADSIALLADSIVVPTPPEPRPIFDLWFDDQLPLGASQKNTSRNAEQWVTGDSVLPPVGERALRMSYGNLHEQTITDGLVPRVIPETAELEVWVNVDSLHPPAALVIEVNATNDKKKETFRYAWGKVESLGRDKFESRNNVRVGDLPEPGAWAKLSIAANQISLTPGSIVDSFKLSQFGGVVLWDGLAVLGSRPATNDPRESLIHWMAYANGRDLSGVPKTVAAALKTPPKDGQPLSEALITEIRREYVKHIARNVPADLTRHRADWQRALIAIRVLEDSIPGTMIFGELPKPRQAHVMSRGQYDAPTDPVDPATPDCLPPLKLQADQERLGRLDLAKWLVRDDHPLTSRVTVNRFWQQVFGTGIVETADDFGTQGALPSHPKLLEWLSADFIQSGWDVKRLVRAMVTSEAFRQSSHCDDEGLEKDPDNRLLARGPRLRLDAEQIRDASLASSGLIDLRLGGRGFWGYQPPGIWEPVGYGNSNTRYYLRDSGADVYRRSLYSFVKRTAPPPFMSNFDAPNRELFCTRRERSNTPLQSLQLMNDVQHVEAARVLAERVLRTGGSDTGERIDLMFRRVLARYPDDTEREELSEVLTRFIKRYKNAAEDATKLIAMGQREAAKTIDARELAAYTLLANLILNLDESITRN